MPTGNLSVLDRIYMMLTGNRYIGLELSLMPTGNRSVLRVLYALKESRPTVNNNMG